MSYQEVKQLSANDFDWSKGPQRGMTLQEPKNMELYLPPHSPQYEDVFNEEIVPRYQPRLNP